mmetsp:Transcript_10612/g.23672  ORF Transcript_10612/g.23672 Transcript_10612/m.23672 type:complete len:86 (+) Transcript_10612:2503-2760(+)
MPCISLSLVLVALVVDGLEISLAAELGNDTVVELNGVEDDVRLLVDREVADDEVTMLLLVSVVVVLVKLVDEEDDVDVNATHSPV